MEFTRSIVMQQILEEEQTGIGAVMRDAEGDVMMAMCQTIEGSHEVEVKEAMVAKQALIIAIEGGLFRVLLETDNLKLSQHIKKKRVDRNNFGTIVKDILGLSERCESFKVSHVKRSGNMVAHQLAKVSKKYGEMRVWVEEAPEEVQDLVTVDFSHI
ncbi:3-methyl-2-oxobutanoate hydroxymethyltransferase [Bienertia sinuspersici]